MEYVISKRGTVETKLCFLSAPYSSANLVGITSLWLTIQANLYYKKNNLGISASRVFTQISRKKWCSTCAVQHNALITVRIVCSVGECHLTPLNASDIFFEDLIVPFNLLYRFSHLVSNILPSIWGFSIIFSQGSFKLFILPWGPR